MTISRYKYFFKFISKLILISFLVVSCSTKDDIFPEPLESSVDDFTIVPISGIELSTVIISAPVTLSGIQAGTTLPLTVLGDDASAKVSINNAAFVTSGQVASGDNIRLQILSSSEFKTIVTAVVRVGDLRKEWEVTTKSIDEEELANLKSDEGFAFFLAKARFMPIDPRDMTADDKQWFSENASFDIDWALTSEEIISDNQLKNAVLYLNGIMKTFNYLVFTKEFSKALKAMFESKDNYLSVTLDSGDNPSVLGTLLVLRSLNTKHAEGGKLYFELERDGGTTHSAFTNPVALDNEKDQFTREEVIAGKRDFNEIYSDRYFNRVYSTRIFIPVGDPINIKNLNSAWEIGCDNNINEKNPYRGFNFNLIVHEMIHAFLGWGHPGPEGEKTIENGHDLVYHTAAVASILVNGLTNGQQITPNLPISEDISIRHTKLVSDFGGHLPMGSFSCYIRLPYAPYSMVTAYYYNDLALPVYEGPALGDEWKSFRPNLNSPKSVPINHFEGIDWKFSYKGFER